MAISPGSITFTLAGPHSLLFPPSEIAGTRVVGKLVRTLKALPWEGRGTRRLGGSDTTAPAPAHHTSTQTVRGSLLLILLLPVGVQSVCSEWKMWVVIALDLSADSALLKVRKIHQFQISGGTYIKLS